jgi:hypothetical protein
VGKEDRFESRIEAMKDEAGGGGFPVALDEEFYKLLRSEAVGTEFDASWKRVDEKRF